MEVDSSSQLDLSLPLDISRLAESRQAVRAFLAANRVPEGCSSDLVLCLQEALKNAMRFSHSSRGVDVSVRITPEGGRRSLGAGLRRGPGWSEGGTSEGFAASRSARGLRSGLFIIAQPADGRFGAPLRWRRGSAHVQPRPSSPGFPRSLTIETAWHAPRYPRAPRRHPPGNLRTAVPWRSSSHRLSGRVALAGE
jgi:hypothetical protein